MNFSGISYESFADGEGVRVSLFVSGCRRHCKGCFNTDAQSFSYGEQFNSHIIDVIMEHVKKPYISGITFLGGEPMEPENVFELIALAQEVRNIGKTVWVYSGFTYEEILNQPAQRRLLSLCDVLVDGSFIEEQRDITLAFRGSRNQRIIDVQKSLESGTIVLWNI